MGAELQTTDLAVPSHVYRHGQFAGCVTDDDHYSPVKPDIYIQLRLEQMMSFYQDRLPIYTKLRFMHRLAMVSLTTVSSILAYLDAAMYVVCATAFSGAILSWIEYSEMARKIERYTRAVRALKKLQSWWEVLSDVEQAG